MRPRAHDYTLDADQDVPDLSTWYPEIAFDAIPEDEDED